MITSLELGIKKVQYVTTYKICYNILNMLQYIKYVTILNVLQYIKYVTTD